MSNRVKGLQMKWLPIMLAFAMLLSGLVPTIGTNGSFSLTEREAQAAVSVNIGEYIQFGKYNDAPILWRVIHKDPTTGDPVLFADRILTIKAFDAAGSYHAGNSARVSVGSSYYPDSNIRQWLNSSSSNSGADTIDWIQNDPSAANMSNSQNPYNTEKGFLANGNFSETERGLIKPLTHKVVLADIDQAKKDGGTEEHEFSSSMSTIVQNYDTTAYYKNVTDSVFLLSVKQLKEWVYDNSATLGENYYIAKPTAESVTQSTFKSSGLNSGTGWTYWLNSPNKFGTASVRYVSGAGVLHLQGANFDRYGVRPAVQLNLASVNFTGGGTGTSLNPYVVTDVPPEFEPPSTPTGLVANDVADTGVSLSWNASTDNVGVTAYEIYSGTTLLAMVAGSSGNLPATTYNLTGLSQGTSYTLTVKARDAAGNRSNASNSVSFTTKYVPTTPVLSSSAVIENSAVNTVIGTLSSTDADSAVPVTFSLVSGSGSTDNGSFNINGTSLRISASFDFETKSSYSIRVRATDSDGFYSETPLTVSVTNVNEAPTLASLPSITVSENMIPSTTLATLSATDPDAGDTLTYSLVSGSGSTDNNAFLISGTTLKTNQTLDYETKSSYSIRLRVTDSGGLTNEKTATINVTDVSEYFTGSSTGKTTFTAAGTAIDSGLTIATNLTGITSSTSISGATVLIENPKSGDSLTNTGTLPSGVTAVPYNGTSGLLRFNGSTTPANWQALLRTVKFTTSSTDNEARVIKFTIGNALPLTQADGSTNYYEVVNTKTGWNTAKTAAEARKTANVLTGYLATTQTQAQYDFLRAQFNVDGWLGGSDEFSVINTATGKTTTTGFANQAASEGKFFWVTGPASERVQFSQGNSPSNTVLPGFYAQWNTSVGDPNNSGGEHYIESMSNGMQDRKENDWSIFGDFTTPNYFVEYSGGTSSLTATVLVEKMVTVTFDSTDGSPVSPITVVYNTEISMPANPTKEGFIFTHWYAKTTAGDPFEIDLTAPISADVTVYAAWNRPPTDVVISKSNFQLGDIVTFGKYKNTPLEWKVIHLDNNGNPLLFADKIYDVKAFDARGAYHPGDDYSSSRFKSGSNYYPDSNLRQWLNSSSPNTGADVIDWIQNDPSPQNMPFGQPWNAYHTEKGFLADGNFTAVERSYVLPHTHKVLLSSADVSKKDGGSAEHIIPLNGPVATSLQNYDTTAYYKNVTDHVFLLSVKQLKEYVYDRGWSITAPLSIAAAYSNGNHLMNSGGPGDGTYPYWLNTPLGKMVELPFSFPATNTRVVFNSSTISSYESANLVIGVRPAMYLNAALVSKTNDNKIVGSAPLAIQENSSLLTEVGALVGSDSDVADILRYDLVTGEGDTDNSAFLISENKLIAIQSFDYESKTSVSIRVRVSDRIEGGASFEKVLTIPIGDVAEAPPNQAPTDISLSASSIAENAGANAVIGTLSAADANAGDTATFDLVSGVGSSDNTAFNVSGSSLRANASFDFEGKSSYSVRVRVTDSGGATFEKQFTISVTNVEDAAPSTPTGLVTTQVTHNSISFSWNPSTDDVAVEAYNVFRNGLYVASTAGTRFTITGLNPLSSHSITVQAYDAARNRSARSTALSVTTVAPLDSIAPTMPTNVTVGKVGGTSIELRWTESTDNIGVTGYNVYLNGVVVRTVTNPSTILSGLSNLTTYAIRVQALDALKNRSALSSTLSITTLDSTAPSAPTNVASSNVTKTGVRVTWTAATDNVAVTNYNIYRNGAYVATVSGTTTAYNLSGLTAGTTYNITVRALDGARNFTNSTALSVTTLP